MPQIYIIVLSNIIAKPAILHETCRLLTLSANDFIARSLTVSLPHFVISRDSGVLDRLAQELAVPLSHVLLQSSHEILSRIFLLPSGGETKNALSFLTSILQDALSNKEKESINVEDLVRSCTVSLITNLVVALGAEATRDAQQV